MSWGSLGEFLDMGGYAFYVWGSYAVTLGLLVTETVSLLSRERAAVKRLARSSARSEKR